MRFWAAITLILSSTFIGADASAYDEVFTHRWLTRAAVHHLQRSSPGQYDHLSKYVENIADGAEHEDDYYLDGDQDPATFRVMRHFFHGDSGLGFEMNGVRYPSSLEWALEEETNEWRWSQGIDAWKEGDAEHAYFVLGHVLHLVQDLTVPAHTHLDEHGPPFGDDYESYCFSQMSDEYSSAFNVPDPSEPVPSFATVGDLWRATASASFWRNMYTGTLDINEAPDGMISEMFPSLSYDTFGATWGIDDPEVGSLGTEFIEELPGWYYFSTTRHAAQSDRDGFSPYAPQATELQPNFAQAPMVELLARDLIPIAILHGAALIAMYDHELSITPVNPPATEAPVTAQGCQQSNAGALPLALFTLAAFMVTRRRRQSC